MNHKEELLKWFDTEMAEQDQDVHPEARQSVLALNKECQVYLALAGQLCQQFFSDTHARLGFTMILLGLNFVVQRIILLF